MPVDPWVAAMNAGANVLGKAVSTPPAGPSAAMQSNPYSWGFDSSGWNVNFGNGTVASSATKSDTSGTGTAAAMNWRNLALAGLGVVALWAVLR